MTHRISPGKGSRTLQLEHRRARHEVGQKPHFLAVLQAKGLMGVGDRFIGRSIIGSAFHCRIDSLTEVAGRPAIYPCISGRAWITGTHQQLLDPSDPWPQGYRLSDTWPGA